MERVEQMRRNQRGKKTLAVILLLVLCMTLPGTEVLAARKDLTHSIWKKKKSTVTVTTPAGVRKYRLYNQTKCKGSDRIYYGPYGCVTTGVSIAVSGFGIKATPWHIHQGKASSKKTERYALKQLKLKRKRQAISLRLASQILTDMGIRNKRVTSFAAAQAEKEIRAHLMKGKPVIVKVKKGQHGGVKFTNRHHTLVLVGLVNDYVVFLNPSTGGVNSSRVGKIKTKINLKLSTLVKKFMYSSRSGTEGGYVMKNSAGGGYILVG